MVRSRSPSPLMVATAAVLLSALVGAARVSQPVKVSSDSPFFRCADGAVGVFPNAEVEPSISANPIAPGNMIILYQQDRFSDGAARGIVAASTFDGGRTWSRTTIPVGYCAHSAMQQPFRATDPWVSFGPDGRAYGLASNIAVTSRDGGRTWTHPVAVDEPTSDYLLDKGSLTADPVRKGTAYAVWARYRRTTNGPPSESDAMFAKTSDGGRTWSRPIVIARHGTRAGPIASQIVADPSHKRLYHFAFWQVGPEARSDGSSRLIVQYSTDGGGTWTMPRTIARAYTRGLRTTDPASGRKVRTGFVVPAFAVDTRTGDLYAAWQDDRFSAGRFDQIVLSRASAAMRWTAPVVVSAPGKQAFDPTVAVNRDGVVGVGYFEMPRSGRLGSGAAQTTYRFDFLRGRNLHADVRSVGEPFRLGDAPLLTGDPALAAPPGLFLGDYMGLLAVSSTFHAAFVTAHPDRSNRTDVYYAALEPPRRR